MATKLGVFVNEDHGKLPTLNRRLEIHEKNTNYVL